jgi:hypothetical protein
LPQITPMRTNKKEPAIADSFPVSYIRHPESGIL